MRHTITFLTSVFVISIASAQSSGNFYDFSPKPIVMSTTAQSEENYELCDKCGLRHIPLITTETSEEILSTIQPDPIIATHYSNFPPMVNEPLIFSGYRNIHDVRVNMPPFYFSMDPRKSAKNEVEYSERFNEDQIENIGSEKLYGVKRLSTDSMLEELPEETAEKINEKRSSQSFEIIPAWLTTALKAQRIYQDIQYSYMINNPLVIDYASWDLPEPPRLPEEDHSFKAFLASLNLPEVDKEAVIIPEYEQKKIHWLHTVGSALQFSQAYISSNWYQGGNNYLALLFNFNWDVALNTNFHPNLMFTSNFAYKLALNSNPKESLHKFSISQDLLQYNLKAGLKAFQKWFYSVTLQFKTQLFNAYPADSNSLGAAFLSPGDFNIGIGMTYNLAALRNTLKFSASISPFSYNLKTCLSDRIDHLQFNIAADRHAHSEIGSNAELNLNWDITANISWKSRLFLFTDYSYFLGDWENTFNFTINKFLSTQIYLHPRFDSSSDPRVSKWRHWSLKEILSFGLSYSFSTKP